MATLPRISSYGNYSSENYGAHCLVVTFDNLTIYYSYKTPVAFRAPGRGTVVRDNDWGPTTGKHLNWIDNGNKAERIPGDAFEKQLQDVLKEFHLSD